MKKYFRIPLFLLIALLRLSFCGCSRYEYPSGHVTGIYHSQDPMIFAGYTLEAQTMELTYENVTYSYSISRNGDAITYTVHYPNGGSYYETRGGGNNTISWNEKYEVWAGYAKGETLVDILSNVYYISHTGPTAYHFIMALVCIGLGCFNLFLPEAAWYFAHLFRSWQYENVDPSDAGITWTRIGGVFLIITGIIVFFMKWS